MAEYLRSRWPDHRAEQHVHRDVRIDADTHVAASDGAAPQIVDAVSAAQSKLLTEPLGRGRILHGVRQQLGEDTADWRRVERRDSLDLFGDIAACGAGIRVGRVLGQPVTDSDP